MAKRQHFKGKKRMKSWHRGQSEARRWRRLGPTRPRDRRGPDSGRAPASSNEERPSDG